jgi:hypothetical protein
MDVQSVVFWAVDNSTPSDNTVGNQGLSHAIGFVGCDTSAVGSTTTLSGVSELVNARIGPSQEIHRLTIPPGALKEAMVEPWAFTAASSGTLPFSQATSIGSIVSGFNTAQGFPEGYPVTCWVEFSGIIELAEPINPAIRSHVPTVKRIDAEDIKTSEEISQSPGAVDSDGRSDQFVTLNSRDAFLSRPPSAPGRRDVPLKSCGVKPVGDRRT